MIFDFSKRVIFSFTFYYQKISKKVLGFLGHISTNKFGAWKKMYLQNLYLKFLLHNLCFILSYLYFKCQNKLSQFVYKLVQKRKGVLKMQQIERIDHFFIYLFQSKNCSIKFFLSFKPSLQSLQGRGVTLWGSYIHFITLT